MDATSEQNPRRTGRPVQFVREDAIEAAMNLFWKRGYLAVSAKDLAEAMEIQRSSLYNSFGSREAIFIEALSRYAALAPDRPLFRVKPGERVARVLASVMRDICRVRAADAEGRGCLVCNSIAELAGVEESLGPLIERSVRGMAAVVGQLLRQADQQGEFTPPGGAKAAADTFVAFLIGLNTVSKVIRDEDQLWAMAAQFLRGLGIAQAVLDEVSDLPTKAMASGRRRSKSRG